VVWRSRRGREPAGLTAEAKLALLAPKLDELRGPWVAADGPALHGPGRTALRVGTSDHGDGVGHLDLEFVLDRDAPGAATITDCVSGFGDDPHEAVEQAAHIWCQTTAPVFFELLTQRGEFAEHARATTPGGFPGWHTILGAVLGWGTGPERSALQTWLLGNPPWTALAPLISEGLDRAELNGVKLFIASNAGNPIAEIRINGRVHRAASDALLALDWPRPVRFTAARTFILLVHRDEHPS
jgi:hypothetical protein